MMNIFDDGEFDEPIDKHPDNLFWLFVWLLSAPIQLFLLLISQSKYADKIHESIVGYDSVSLFSIGNYAHAQYMHWIDDAVHSDCQIYTRWNLP